MAKVPTCKKIVTILPLFLFDIILTTVDIGTDAVLISKLYATNYACCDYPYETCNNKIQDTLYDDYCQNQNICQLENETYICNHTGTFEICSKDPKLFCTSNSGYKNGVSCNCGFHPVYASALLFIFLLNYLVSWINWARLTEYSMRWNTFIFPLLNYFPQFGEFHKFK